METKFEKTCAICCASTKTFGQVRRDFRDEPRAARLDERPQILKGALHQFTRLDHLARQHRFAGLQLREIEQVVDHSQQPLGILARGEEQFRLLVVERADAFFEQKMQAHAHTGQRRLQLVADRRDEIRLYLIEQAQTRHVLKNDGGAEDVARFIPHPDDARQHENLMVADAENDHALEARREKIGRALEDAIHFRLHARRQAILLPACRKGIWSRPDW